MRADAVERRVLDAIDFARRICPGYAMGTAPARRADIERLARYLNVKIRSADLDHPALLMPPIGGHYHLLIDGSLHRGTWDFLVRHELGHVLAGDVAQTADELLIFQFTGALPEAETVADLFAFADLIAPQLATEQCVDNILPTMMRAAVEVDYPPWYLRIPELAPRLVRLQKLIEERL